MNVKDIFKLRLDQKRHIKALLERNLITHQGSKKTGGYFAK